MSVVVDVGSSWLPKEIPRQCTCECCNRAKRMRNRKGEWYWREGVNLLLAARPQIDLDVLVNFEDSPAA